ncbi:MAG: hypothetical protein H7Z18_01825 [Methylophilaceae bacterium]|nr:hypothetical protein [Methylophilaceae bacterium]
MIKLMTIKITILIASLLIFLQTSSAIADEASILQEKYLSLTEQLKINQFKRPIHLDSVESSSTIKGDIYAVIDYPFTTVDGTLNEPKQGPVNWCNVLILHVNTKYCRVTNGNKGPIINLYVGKKVKQELADTYHLQFDYRTAITTKDYFRVDLNADGGPLGTKDYRIVLEAVPISNKQTFIHLTYAYGYGLAGRVAMKTYLNTVGSGKVGFSKMEAVDTGTPQLQDAAEQYVGGVRGLVERNTMRYYLAIDAYLSSLNEVPEKRMEQRLNKWFSATEEYPRQLHEIDKQEYMQMKNEELSRQKILP